MLVHKKKNVKERHCRSRSTRMKKKKDKRIEKKQNPKEREKSRAFRKLKLCTVRGVWVLFFLYLMLDMTLNDLLQLLFPENSRTFHFIFKRIIATRDERCETRKRRFTKTAEYCRTGKFFSHCNIFGISLINLQWESFVPWNYLILNWIRWHRQAAEKNPIRNYIVKEFDIFSLLKLQVPSNRTHKRCIRESVHSTHTHIRIARDRVNELVRIGPKHEHHHHHYNLSFDFVFCERKHLQPLPCSVRMVNVGIPNRQRNETSNGIAFLLGSLTLECIRQMLIK